MNIRVLPITALLFIATTANAQLHAGEIPAGATAVDVGIDLLLSAPFTVDAATFEIDCDDQPDIRAALINGAPPIDAPNVAMLHLLDDDLELCTDMATLQRPQYYTAGQLLDCTGSFDWHSDSVNVLGDMGSFMAIGPVTVDSMYVAYRRGAQVGWILLSFDVGGTGSSRLRIHQVLPICPAIMSIDGYDSAPAITLFPNPSNGEPIRIESAGAVRSIDVLDATGRIMAHYGSTVRTITAPEVAGAYLVRVGYADGRRSIVRLVRY